MALQSLIKFSSCNAFKVRVTLSRQEMLIYRGAAFHMVLTALLLTLTCCAGDQQGDCMWQRNALREQGTSLAGASLRCVMLIVRRSIACSPPYLHIMVGSFERDDHGLEFNPRFTVEDPVEKESCLDKIERYRCRSRYAIYYIGGPGESLI